MVPVSGSLRYWLESVAADLGFHHLLCTDLEVRSDGLSLENSLNQIDLSAHSQCSGSM